MNSGLVLMYEIVGLIILISAFLSLKQTNGLHIQLQVTNVHSIAFSNLLYGLLAWHI